MEKTIQTVVEILALKDLFWNVRIWGHCSVLRNIDIDEILKKKVKFNGGWQHCLSEFRRRVNVWCVECNITELPELPILVFVDENNMWHPLVAYTCSECTYYWPIFLYQHSGLLLQNACEILAIVHIGHLI